MNNRRKDYEDKRRDQDDRGKNPRPRGPVINMIFGGPTAVWNLRNSRKAYDHDVMHIVGEPSKRESTGASITFEDLDLEGVKFPHYDMLVIMPMIGNNEVKSVLIENGDLVDILFHDVFLKMGYNDSQLTLTDVPIYGFNGVEFKI